MINNTKFWFLENFNLMNEVGRLNLLEVFEVMEMSQIKKGEEIYFNREDKEVIYFLKTGLVKIVSKSKNHTKYIVKKGGVFGELALLDDEDDAHSEFKAVALKDSAVCFIGVD